MSIIGIDPQAIGWHDDGTESGAIRTQAAGGDLVAVPFPTMGYVRTVSGSGTGSLQHIQTPNSDGSGNGFRMTTPATGSGVRCFVPFRGTTFGVRYLIPATSTEISVGVDGEHVAIDLAETAMLAESTTFVSTEGSRITHRDLDADVLHMAEITMVYDGSATKEAYIHGFLLDRSAGYEPPPRRLQAREAATVTTSATAFNVSNNAHVLGGVSAILYSNTTAADITVTITLWNGSTVAVVTVPANGTYHLDLGGVVTNARSWRHAASATGVVATIIGGAL